MPTQLGEGMTGSRTNPALPPTYLRHHGLEKEHNHTTPPLPLRHPTTACTRPAQRQDRSSSLRCGRSVLTPVPTRRCPHGGRKPAKPLVANVLTEPHPFRDDNLRTWDVYRKTSHASLMRSALCVLLVSGCEA